MADRDGIYGFRYNDAHTLRHLARDAQWQGGETGNNGQGGRSTGREKRIAKTNSGGIPARSGDTAGVAPDIEWYTLSGSGEMIAVGSTMTVYNIYGSDVSGDTYITVVKVGGLWIIDSEDCS